MVCRPVRRHRGPMDTSSHVVGVLGASGGLGASSLTSALALRAGDAGRGAVVVDGVRLGGGVDVTMGLEQEDGLRWPDLARVRGAVDGGQLLGRLPATGRVRALSFDRTRPSRPSPQAVRSVLAGLGAACPLVAVDLPSPDSALWDCLLELCSKVVLLAGSSPQALAAATAMAPHACDGPRACVCVRTATGADELAEIVAAGVGLPLAAVLHHERGLDTGLWRGLPPGSDRRGALAEAADDVLAWLALGAHTEVA